MCTTTAATKSEATWVLSESGDLDFVPVLVACLSPFTLSFLLSLSSMLCVKSDCDDRVLFLLLALVESVRGGIILHPYTKYIARVIDPSRFSSYLLALHL